MAKRQEILNSTIEKVKSLDKLTTFDEVFCSMYVEHSYWKESKEIVTKLRGVNIHFTKDSDTTFKIVNEDNTIFTFIEPNIDKILAQYKSVINTFV